MSVNRQKPHLLVLPEDDANRQIANGFSLGCDQTRQIQILPVAGGWRKVLQEFREIYASSLEAYPLRLLVLLLDFDDHLQERRKEIRETVNESTTVSPRVFALGALTTPEDLRKQLGRSFETIGTTLAGECRTGASVIWTHRLLDHNREELERLRPHASVLFDAT